MSTIGKMHDTDLLPSSSGFPADGIARPDGTRGHAGCDRSTFHFYDTLGKRLGIAIDALLGHRDEKQSSPSRNFNSRTTLAPHGMPRMLPGKIVLR